MKKHPFVILLFLTCILAAFLLGFFLGRNQNHETLVLSSVASQPRHDAPVVTAPAEEGTVLPELFPIDINTASVYDLAALSGIGETIARRIVQYRTLNGPFASPEELLNVEGIGPGKLEAILDDITTGGNCQ